VFHWHPSLPSLINLLTKCNTTNPNHSLAVSVQQPKLVNRVECFRRPRLSRRSSVSSLPSLINLLTKCNTTNPNHSLAVSVQQQKIPRLSRRSFVWEMVKARSAVSVQNSLFRGETSDYFTTTPGRVGPVLTVLLRPIFSYEISDDVKSSPNFPFIMHKDVPFLYPSVGLRKCFFYPSETV
jgi:hypothetical protein